MNLNQYANNIDYVLAVFNKNKEQGASLDDTASIISATIHVPLIAVLYFIAIQEGQDEEFHRKINLLKDFYSITEIIPLEKD